MELNLPGENGPHPPLLSVVLKDVPLQGDQVEMTFLILSGTLSLQSNLKAAGLPHSPVCPGQSQSRSYKELVLISGDLSAWGSCSVRSSPGQHHTETSLCKHGAPCRRACGFLLLENSSLKPSCWGTVWPGGGGVAQQFLPLANSQRSDPITSHHSHASKSCTIFPRKVLEGLSSFPLRKPFLAVIDIPVALFSSASRLLGQTRKQGIWQCEVSSAFAPLGLGWGPGWCYCGGHSPPSTQHLTEPVLSLAFSEEQKKVHSCQTRGSRASVILPGGASKSEVFPAGSGWPQGGRTPCLHFPPFWTSVRME